MIQKTIAFLFFVISFSIHSQPNELMNRLYIANQNINNIIPNKITESKSVVLYLIDNKNTNEELNKLHQRFLKTNIDVVNYINLDDFLIDKKIYMSKGVKEQLNNIRWLKPKSPLIITDTNITNLYGNKGDLKNNFIETNKYRNRYFFSCMDYYSLDFS